MLTTEPSLVDELACAEGKAEIIHGQIAHLSMTGIEPGYAGDELLTSLRYYPKNGIGLAVGDGKGFLAYLLRCKSFSPDAAFYTGPTSSVKFSPEAPIFAVEVRSEGDYGLAAERDMTAKRADCFAAGTQVDGDVDLLGTETGHVFQAHNVTTPAAVYRCGDYAETEGAIPGWKIPVDDLFQA